MEKNIESMYYNADVIEKFKEIEKSWLFNFNSDFNKEVNKGYFMSTMIKELYLILILANKNQFKIDEMINNSEYKEEFDIFNQICSIIGFNYRKILNLDINALSRKEIEEKFYLLTRNTNFWNKFESQLDLFISNKDNPNFRENYIKYINLTLDSALEYSMVNGMVSSAYYCNFMNNFANVKLKTI